MCLKRPQLENWFLKRFNNQSRKRKSLLGLTSSRTRRLPYSSPLKHFPSRELRKTKLLYLETVGVWSCSGGKATVFWTCGVTSFLVTLGWQGLHSSGRSTGGVQVCTRHVVGTEGRTRERKGRGDSRLRNGLREMRTGTRHGYVKSSYKFIRSCACLFKKSPKFTFQKRPAHCPYLGASVKVHAQKLQRKI